MVPPNRRKVHDPTNVDRAGIAVDRLGYDTLHARSRGGGVSFLGPQRPETGMEDRMGLTRTRDSSRRALGIGGWARPSAFRRSQIQA